MEPLKHIDDSPLLIDESFNSLKKEALDYIQINGSTQWTNFNASDPGITILDQLCYALTELGYVTNFPMADILTNSDGSLIENQQFYEPDIALTTAPATILDYRKYIINLMPAIANVIFVAVTSSTRIFGNHYEVYLKLRSRRVSETISSLICKTAFIELNKSRNLGQLFLIPKVFKENTYLLSGTITVSSFSNLRELCEKVQTQIDQFIFPTVQQTGYEQLTQEGVSANTIFNGPLLNNGWIKDQALGTVKKSLTALEVQQLFTSFLEIAKVSDLGFLPDSSDINENDAKPAVSVTAQIGELICVDLVKSIGTTLKVINLAEEVATNLMPEFIPRTTEEETNKINVRSVNSVSIKPKLPQGNYRDIESYYSIQNTFPEIFGVGEHGISTNATDFQISQSRQLKGYLTLFDQLLANQFSQVAHLGTLFSFQNSTSNDPLDRKAFYSSKNQFQKKHGEYPVPFERFLTTYFYQSLYHIPHISPLLINGSIFRYGNNLETPAQLDAKSWEAYKEYAYNTYNHRLRFIMEDDTSAIERRNAILDHLLARHGESPIVVNAILDGTEFTGEPLKDRVIVKSLFLQNLGLLSYHRQCAYNYVGGALLSADLPEITSEEKEMLLASKATDFIFNSDEINLKYKLSKNDFNNYAASELKLSLLLGLQVVYENYIASLIENEEHSDLQKLAYWMIKQRKGLFFIEINLLLKEATSEFTFTSNVNHGPYWQLNAKVSYAVASKIMAWFDENKDTAIDKFQHTEKLTIEDTTYKLTQVSKVALPKSDFIVLSSKAAYACQLAWGSDVTMASNDVFFDGDILSLFPEFVMPLKSKKFEHRLGLFFDETLPLAIQNRTCFLTKVQLQKLIPLFVNWSNFLRRIVPAGTSLNNAKTPAGQLIQFLRTLKSKSYD